MERINSYPNIYALGHRAIKELLNTPVVVQEKVDGSQFSMCKQGGVLTCRSKGQQLVIDAPEKMFLKAVETAKALDLRDGWVYRCEYLQSPKHNTLAYERIPTNHLIVFDVMTGLETYLGPDAMKAEAARIGLESVPCFLDGPSLSSWNPSLLSAGVMEEFLHRDSILGGVKIEGIVVKNYSLFTPDKKVAMAKFVSKAFQEKHLKEWKSSNPSSSDVVQLLISELTTEARWSKAVQHLKEKGMLDESPRDIGNLIKETQADVKAEESDYIKEKLFAHFWPTIQRSVIHGLPEWYKEKLASTVLK